MRIAASMAGRVAAGRGAMALASGVGVDLIHNEARRPASADVPGCVDSSVVRERRVELDQVADVLLGFPPGARVDCLA